MYIQISSEFLFSGKFTLFLIIFFLKVKILVFFVYGTINIVFNLFVFV